MTRSRISMIGVTAAILFAAFIRFRHIGGQSLWFDEGYTAWLVSLPPGRIVQYANADTSPPLYYLLLHGWTGLFGNSESALRGLSALAGILIVALAAAIARRLNTAACAAAWLTSLSWWLVAYSAEARSYELSAFWCALVLYAVIRHLDKPHWKWLLLTVGTGIAGIYTNNFVPLYLAAIGAAALILPSATPMRRRLRDGAIVAAVILAVYVPWITVLSTQIARVRRDFWIPAPGLLAVCQEISRIAGVEHFWTWDRYVHWLLPDTQREVPILAAVGVLLAVGLRCAEKQFRTPLALACCALLPPVLAAGVSQGPRSIFLPAAFLPSAVMLAILLAGFRLPVVLPIALLLAVNLIAFKHEQDKEDWRTAAQVVAAMPPVQRRLIVFVANEGELPFDYYYRLRAGEEETGAPEGFFDGPPDQPPRTQRRVLTADDLRTLRERLASVSYSDVVLVSAHTDYADPGELTVGFLREVLRLTDRTDLPKGITIRRFEATALAALTTHEPLR